MTNQIDHHNMTSVLDLGDTTTGGQADASRSEPCGVCDQRGGHLPGCIGALEGMIPSPADECADPAYRFSRPEPSAR